MTAASRRLLAAATVAIACGVAASAGAQLTAPPADFVPEAPVAAEPHRIETSTPAVTQRVLAKEALRYLEQLGITVTPPTSAPPGAAAMAPVLAAPVDAGGISRTIAVEAAPAVNASPLFTFRDVTVRGAGDSAAVVPMTARRAAVEAYRQSLAREGAATR